MKRDPFAFNPRRYPEDLIEALNDFASGRQGWRVHENGGSPYAARRFEYPFGKQAQISLRLGPTRWESHITTPFSSGPKENFLGKKVGDVEPWIKTKTDVLCLPLRMAECRTYDAAFEMVSKLDAAALYTLSYVFDIDLEGTTASVIRHRLVVACGIRPAKGL